MLLKINASIIFLAVLNNSEAALLGMGYTLIGFAAGALIVYLYLTWLEKRLW